MNSLVLERDPLRTYNRRLSVPVASSAPCARGQPHRSVVKTPTKHCHPCTVKSSDRFACFQDKTGRPNIEMFVETAVYFLALEIGYQNHPTKIAGNVVLAK